MLLWPAKSSASFYWPLAAAAAPPIMLATSRQLAASFFTQLAGGDSYVAVWRLPVCGRDQHGSLPVGPRACRSVSRSQSRCAIVRCYSDPHTVGSGVSRLPVTAAFPVECIRFSAICASAPKVRMCVMPEMRMNSLKSRAMNCGPLSEMIHGFASVYFSWVRCRITSMSASLMDSRRSQCSRKRLNPSRTLHK